MFTVTKKVLLACTAYEAVGRFEVDCVEKDGCLDLADLPTTRLNTHGKKRGRRRMRKR